MTEAHQFKDKAAAFAWYVEQGGQRQKSSFYAVVPADGKRVSRFAVSSLLLEESRKRRETPAASMAEFDSARDEARYTKARADREELRRDEELRELDQKWLHIDKGEELVGLWVDFAFNACVERVNRALPALIHACGGDPGRLPEAREVLDQAHDAAGNDLANAGEITAFFEVEE
jgi:hypothetical protein